MIEITVIEDGNTAYAETPEDALYAALTISRESKAHRGVQGFDPTICFKVDGKVVKTTTLRALTRG